MRYNAPMHYLSSYRLFITSVLAALNLTAALLVLAACGLPGSTSVQPTPTAVVVVPTATATPTPTATPEPIGGSLSVGLASDIVRLRPWRPGSRGEEQVIGLLYSGLMRLDADLRPQPDLALDWATTPDGRVITFTLRDDVNWHDGEDFDADDVRFTLEQMRSLPFTSTALLADLRRIAAIAIPDRHTVVLSLTERYAPLLAELTLPMLPAHLLQDRDIASLDFWEVPIGSGPFKLVERTPGSAIVLARNDDHYRTPALLETIHFRYVPVPADVLDALQNERLLLAELPGGAADRLEQQVTTVRSETYAENGFYFLGFNLREGRAFADARVRQALALAIDVPRLVEAATQGQGIPLSSSAVPGSWADLLPPPRRGADPESARALLTEAGWLLPTGATIRQRNGEPFVVRLFVRSDDERRLVAAQRIAESAASIGMDMQVVAAPFEPTIISKYVPPYDFDLLLGSWLNGAGDPDFGDFAYYDPDDFALFHSSQINRGPIDTRVTRNFVAFSDSAYDNLAQEARQLYENDQRAEAQRQAQERIAELRPYIYLWADPIPVALNTRVTTLDGPVDLTTPNYLWNIETWYVER